MPVLSSTELAKIEEKADKYRDALTRVKERAKEELERTIQQGEVALTAGLMGYMRGRYPEKFQKGIFGYSPDLALAVGIDLAVMTGFLGGETGKHAFNVATGALASFALCQGLTAGAKAAKAAGGTGVPYIGDPTLAEGRGGVSESDMRHVIDEMNKARAGQ